MASDSNTDTSTYDLNNYQSDTNTTAIYPGQGTVGGINYNVLALAGEFGELAGKWSKHYRDESDPRILTNERREQLLDEAADGFWHLSQFCSDIGITLNDLAERNIDKLRGRAERGTLHGDGDKR